MDDRVFTGDTLLIRGTGRTDFQNGDPRAQYEFDLQPAAEAARRDAGLSRRTTTRATRVSTIGEEKRFNPRLQVKSVDEYVDADERPEPAEPEDDGRRGAGQHACQGLRQEEIAAARLGAVSAPRRSALLRPRRTSR